MALVQRLVVVLCLGLFSPSLSASAQLKTPSTAFLTQGGGIPGNGAEIKPAPPASLTTPQPMVPPVPGPAAALYASLGKNLTASGHFTVLLALLTVSWWNVLCLDLDGLDE